jgi:hypothetical protein
MRRKRRRQKSWLARLFSPKARDQSKPDVKPQVTRSPTITGAPPKVPAAVTGSMSRALSSVMASLPPEAYAKKLARKEEAPATSSADAMAPSQAPDSRKSPTGPSEAGPRKRRPLRVIKPGDPGVPPLSESALSPEDEEKPMTYWRKVGGGSLVLSITIHLVFLLIASFVVTSVVRKPHIDFLAGGGSKSGQAASQELAQQVKTRKRTLLNKAVPLRKVVSTSTASAIALPDLPMNTIALPEMASVLGGHIGSGGFGDSGAGGGFGTGMGLGGMSGRTFKPIIMFGKNINARSIAVILDVSGSMTPHLSRVIEELDRVAKGSPVVLYVGCGVERPPNGVKLDEETLETRRSPRFRAFWTEDHGPEKDVYDILAKRPFTYFMKSQGVPYAWIALLNDQVRHAEALYWFSDFQDAVDNEQLETVLENFKRRKQKLYIHASEEGSSFEKVRDRLCLPSGGAVIQSR